MSTENRPNEPLPHLTLTAVVLDAPDAAELAAFYRLLLGWKTEQDEPGWVKIGPPGGGTALSFQTEPEYIRPVWPADPDAQRMMLHLDIEADRLDTAVAHALASGAVLADEQPQDDVRVLLDPAGHPFCLWVRE